MSNCLHCDSSAYCRDLCIRHYERFRIYGNPLEPSHKRAIKKCTECARDAVARELCRSHYDKLRRTGVRGGPLPRRDMSRLDLYLDKVDRRGDDECWPWTGARSEKNYGSFANPPERKNMAAHRYGFGALVRSLEPGEVVDHTCHNDDDSCPGGNTCEHRACQNPAHWEAVDNETNGARGKSFSAKNSRLTHCPAQHEYTPDNIYWVGKNKDHRQCKICTKAKARARSRETAVKTGRREIYAAARAAGMSPADASRQRSRTSAG